MNKKAFTIINETTCYDGFFKLKKFELTHTLHKGGWSVPISRELFERGNCVGVLLYDPRRDEVVIIEQFRVGAMHIAGKEWLLEIVAGAIDKGETAAQVAHREAIEEADCKIEELVKINEFLLSPGGTSELITLFCAKVDTTDIGGIHGIKEEGEDILVSAIKFADAYQLLLAGKIMSAIPIVAIQWLYINRDTLREKWLTA